MLEVLYPVKGTAVQSFVNLEVSNADEALENVQMCILSLPYGDKRHMYNNQFSFLN